MIIGVGIDIVEIDRIKSSMERYSDRFISRVFCESEIDYCKNKGNPAIHFAARFAAKEAVVKSLGTGFSGGIKWTDVEIINPGVGRPTVKLHGQAWTVFKAIGGGAIHLSLTHSARFAAAQVVCEKLENIK